MIDTKLKEIIPENKSFYKIKSDGLLEGTFFCDGRKFFFNKGDEFWTDMKFDDKVADYHQVRFFSMSGKEIVCVVAKIGLMEPI